MSRSTGLILTKTRYFLPKNQLSPVTPCRVGIINKTPFMKTPLPSPQALPEHPLKCAPVAFALEALQAETPGPGVSDARFPIPRRGNIKFFAPLLLLLLSITPTQAQHALSPTLIESYASIGRVWGFLKYYHPHVGNGTLNWDQILVEALAASQDLAPQQMCNRVIDQLLVTAGPIDECEVCFEDPGDQGISTVNWQWMESSPYLTEDQATALGRVRDQRDLGDSLHRAYLPNWQGVSLNFVMDSAYSDVASFTQWHRLLALYHYWNVIEYFSPYRQTANPDWEQVLEDFIPRFLAAEGERALQYTMWELVNQVNDSHGGGGSAYLSEHGYGKYWLPFWARLSDDRRVFITELRNDSIGLAFGLKDGDEILHINGTDIETLLAEKRPFEAASNATAKDIYCLWLALKDTLPMATLKVARADSVFDLEVPRFAVSELRANEYPDWYWADSQQTVIVARANSLISRRKARDFMKEASHADAIVLDFRMGAMPYEARNYLYPRMLPQNQLAVTAAHPSRSFPGNWMDNQLQYTPERQRSFWDKPLILLAGEYNISQDEWVIMYFQTSPRAYTIGRPTGGALGYMARIEMPGGFAAYFTSGYMSYPDGSPVFGPGVKLDEQVEPTAEQLSQGRDAEVERALQFLQTQLDQP